MVDVIAIEKWKRSRFWAVLVDGELVAVCVYKRGAKEVAALLERAI